MRKLGQVVKITVHLRHKTLGTPSRIETESREARQVYCVIFRVNRKQKTDKQIKCMELVLLHGAPGLCSAGTGLQVTVCLGWFADALTAGE